MPNTDSGSKKPGLDMNSRTAADIAVLHLRRAKSLRFRYWPAIFSRPTKRLGVFPYPLKNPFLPLLYWDTPVDVFALPSLRRGARLALAGHLDALHIHFEDQMWRRTRFEPKLSAEDASGAAIEMLTKLKKKGKGLVWTLHNAENHYGDDYPEHVKSLRNFLAREADLLHVFNDAGVRHAVDVLGAPADSVVKVEHPSYFGCYGGLPKPMAPPKQRRFLCFGTILPSKGIESFLDCIGRADIDGLCGRITVAGPYWEGTSPDLESYVPLNREVELRYGYVEDHDVAPMFDATDFAVLNYSRVLTSGFACLAMTMGKPIIAPDRGGIREAVPPENLPLLFDPNDATGLKKAIEHACRMDGSEHLSLQHACLAFAERYHPSIQSRRLWGAMKDRGVFESEQRRREVSCNGNTCNR